MLRDFDISWVITKTRPFKYIENFTTKKKKTENFQIKMSDIFIFLLKTSRRGGSKEYPQSMFFSKIRKIMYTPVNPSFAI